MINDSNSKADKNTKPDGSNCVDRPYVHWEKINMNI